MKGGVVTEGNKYITKALTLLIAVMLMAGLLLIPVYALSTSGSITSGQYSFDYSSAYSRSSYGLGNGTSGSHGVDYPSGASFSYTAESTKYTAWNKNAGSGTGTLTITNNTGSIKKVSLKWNFSYDTSITYQTTPSASVLFAGTEVVAGSLYTNNLGAGETIVITVTAHGTGYKDTNNRAAVVTVTDFSIADADPINIDIGAVAGATTTAVSGDTTKTASTEDQRFVFYGAGDTIALSCDVDAGYTMQGWMINSKFISGTDDYTYTVGNNAAIIYPVVLSDSYVGDFFEVNGAMYDTWDTAIAATGGSGTVILRKDYPFPTTLTEQGLPACGGCYVKHATDENGSVITTEVVYTLPAGVTLLVPYSDTDEGLVEPKWSSNLEDCTYRNGGTACTTAYKTLTVPQNVSLANNGILIINGQVSGNSVKNEGTVFGTYGKMIVAGNVTVNGTLYARGYIVDSNHTSHADGNGTGLITVTGNGKVFMPLQILDYRGGNASSDVYGWIFPISQYKFQNIMVRVKYEHGAALHGQYFTSVSDKNWSTSTWMSAQMTIGTKQLFGPTIDCFIQMTEGDIYTDYDYNSDQLIISIDGTAAFNDLSVKITTSLATINVTTAGKEIPIPYGIGIKVLEGATVNLDKKVKLLPGSWVDIQRGGTVNLSGSAYLYDNTSYQNSWSYAMEAGQLNVPGIIKTSGVTTWNKDAVVYVAGTLNITGTITESSAHSGGIIACDGGVITAGSSSFAKGATTYEMANAGTDKVTVTWDEVSGLLAGLSTSATDYRSFSTSGAGTYYATGNWASDTNAAWYQHVITVDNGIAGAVAVNGGGSVGETDGYVSITRGTGENATTTENVVGYSVNNGTFKFKAPGFTVSVGDTELTPSNGTYTLSNVTADTTLSCLIKIMATNIVVSNGLDMYFYVNADCIPENSGYTAVVTKHFADNREDAIGRFTVDEWKANGEYVGFGFSDISAKEMTDDIEVTIYDSNGTAVSKTYTQSVQDYVILTLKQDSTTDALRTALIDMLNYGAAAQQFFNYNTGVLANVDPKDESVISTNSEFATSNVGDCNNTLTDPPAEFAGVTVSAKNTLMFTFYFYIDDPTGMVATITYTDHNNTPQTETVRAEDFYMRSEGLYGVDVERLSIVDGRCMMNCTIRDGAGNAVVTVSDSIEGYVARKSDGNDDIFEQMMKFVDSAVNYFDSLKGE